MKAISESCEILELKTHEKERKKEAFFFFFLLFAFVSVNVPYMIHTHTHTHTHTHAHTQKRSASGMGWKSGAGRVHYEGMGYMKMPLKKLFEAGMFGEEAFLEN